MKRFILIIVFFLVGCHTPDKVSRSPKIIYDRSLYEWRYEWREVTYGGRKSRAYYYTHIYISTDSSGRSWGIERSPGGAEIGDTLMIVVSVRHLKKLSHGLAHD